MKLVGVLLLSSLVKQSEMLMKSGARQERGCSTDERRVHPAQGPGCVTSATK